MRFLLIVASCLMPLLAGAARGADVSIGEIQVGFAGHYKAGEWTPLNVRIEGAADPSGWVVETETLDADGSTVIRASESLSLEPIAEQSWLRTVFQAGRLGSSLAVRIRDASGTIRAERRFRSGTEHLPVALTDEVPLWVSTLPLGDTRENAESGWSEQLRLVTARSPLPTDPLAYRAIDLLIVPGDLEASPKVLAAIQRYVAVGGRLMISLGERTDPFESTTLAEWVPIETSGTIQLRDFSDLEDFAKLQPGLQRLPARARVRIAAMESAARAVLPWRGTNHLLVARDAFGFGDVTLIAFDLFHPTFAQWNGLPMFIERSMRDSPERPGPPRTDSNVSDLATQLILAEDDFPGLRRISVGQSLLLLLLFAVVVGPLDYLLVHRWLKRPALTWVTLPLLVIGAAWWLNYSAHAANGTQSLYNEITLWDYDLASQTTRGKSMVSLYAAAPIRADLVAHPQVIDKSLGVAVDGSAVDGSAVGGNQATKNSLAGQMGWVAAPEENFGGLYRDASGGMFLPAYQVAGTGDDREGKGIPMLAWSSRQLSSIWSAQGQASPVSADLRAYGAEFLEGTISHELSSPIKNWMIVFGNQIYTPAEEQWPPGKPLSIGSTAFTRRDARSLLTGQTQITVEKKSGQAGSEYLVKETAYDRNVTDPAVITRMLSFHDIAGGSDYTKLTNTLWSRDDLSPLLGLGRAVLWGEVEPPEGAWRASGEGGAEFTPARRRMFVRIVLPVEKNTPRPLPSLEREQ